MRGLIITLGWLMPCRIFLFPLRVAGGVIAKKEPSGIFPEEIIDFLW